ncbi:ATP-grasp domain-containing protein [Amycolatopsis sp. H20-H5]|uniref:ATP-grasp domain-containing protein n=1 Tax=Amycolatopsis sp. H20-H5 TaxID=3046309 RepID=UPI002DBA8FFF|nr:ATP-grasp domain-containing protein [Amycolatopsis sp. H20-H5]MEC3982168.1 ATP-grasp domain-containing protein [Amycolatopsis sp. H20-H5]
MLLLLIPADVLRPRRPDEHFASEAAAAREAGMDVALVDHNALTRADGAEEAVAKVRSEGEAVYRGWMLRSEQYAAFDEALTRRGVRLRTTTEQYQRAHELPGWYDALAALTPRSAWTTGDDRAAFDKACGELGSGRAVLRDYTKSMKHYWTEAAYLPDLSDADAAWRVASRFRELRDDAFTGGFVVREFEELTAAEVRTWWVDGQCRLIGPHPDTPDDTPPADLDLGGLAPVIARLGLPFVTVDLALRADGGWRVVELGDGQVSDRPSTLAPAEFVAQLTAA